MDISVLQGILIPFIGTTLGAAMVFLLKDSIPPKIKQILLGFSAGVMVSASFWGLLLPAIESEIHPPTTINIMVIVGFLCGMGFLLLLDQLIPHMHLDNAEEGVKSKLSKTTKLLLAITIHNIPEGMAVGVVFANWISGGDITLSAAMTLAIGIAIQNFPEGAVVSMPLHAEGMSKPKTFLYGTLTGAVEPIAAIITILLLNQVLPMMPFLLAFAAGAMMYVVVEELIPEMKEDAHSNIGTIAFAIGFAVMMALDIVLG